jgi:hypothetical protein
MAERRLDIQLAAGGKSEADIVQHLAGYPALLGHARDGGKPHSGGPAYHFQDGRDRCDTLHRLNVILNVVCHKKRNLLSRRQPNTPSGATVTTQET